MKKKLPHPRLLELSDAQLRKIKHAIGFDSDSPFYRNYYQVKYDADWEDLIMKGIAAKATQFDLNYYYLTSLGKAVIRSIIPSNKLTHEAF